VKITLRGRKRLNLPRPQSMLQELPTIAGERGLKYARMILRYCTAPPGMVMVPKLPSRKIQKRNA
jgi:hypothetical protein